MSDKCKDYPIETNFTLLKDYTIQPPFSIGINIPYHCSHGYVLTETAFTKKNQTPVFTCKLVNNSAIWEMDTECIPISCGDPGYVENATRSDSEYLFSKTVKFTCHYGYKMKGNFFQREKIRYCDVNGNWSPPLHEIQCVPDGCSYLLPPVDGFITYTNHQFIGSEAQYSCKKGYQLSGNPTRKCSDSANWTGSAPECKIICPPPDPIPNGTIYQQRNIYTLHDSITYYCPATDQSLMSKCKENGKWSSPPPLCELKEPLKNLSEKKLQKSLKKNRKKKKKKFQNLISYFIYSILILLIIIIIYKRRDNKRIKETEDFEPVEGGFT